VAEAGGTRGVIVVLLLKSPAQVLQNRGFRMDTNYKYEHGLLKSAGICNEGPIRYKRARERGDTASSMCNPFLNIAWIIDNMQDKAAARRVKELMVERETCQTEIETARKALNSKSIESLCRNSR
jgi:hypothetical protein